MIVWEGVGLLLTVTDISTTCAVVIFRVIVSCITSVVVINPFAPEPPVTARADPGPFYPL